MSEKTQKSADKKAPQDKKLEKKAQRPFYFPEQGVTIVASSIEEAQEKLAQRNK